MSTVETPNAIAIRFTTSSDDVPSVSRRRTCRVEYPSLSPSSICERWFKVRRRWIFRAMVSVRINSFILHLL